MLFSGEFLPGIDLVSICNWTFLLFFIGLVFYIQQESRREGYPLESDTRGRVEDKGQVWYGPKKAFHLPHGRGTVLQPHGTRDTRNHALRRTAVWPGAPYEPTGNPMKDAVGPASYAERMDLVDLTDDGRPRIAPMRLGDGYDVANEDADPRGMTVYGCDDQPGGVVVDLWVDRSEAIIRYMEVNVGTSDAPKNVLLPIPFAVVKGSQRRINVHAITGAQFADVPQTKVPDEVTRLEEDKVSGYYGGGKLYATPDRVEPWI
ncbi:MAG: photosynthetic reaction center subunit H [Pseudomonadota bacterium]